MSAALAAVGVGAAALAAPALAAAAAYRIHVGGKRAHALTALGAIAATVVLAASALGAPPAAALSVAAIAACALAIAAFDARLFLIPDGLVVVLAALALAAPFAPDPMTQALGAATLGGLFLGVRLVYRRMRRVDGLGLGDVKLAAAMGLLLGPERGLIAVAAAAIIAAAWLMARGRPAEAGASSPALDIPAGPAAPFGVALALALVAFLAIDLTPWAGAAFGGAS